MKIRSRLSRLTTAGFRSAVAASRTFGSESNLRGRARPSSYPFVSGDTFRAVSDVVFDVATMRGIESEKITMPAWPEEPSIIFIEYNVLDGARWRQKFLDWMESSSDYSPGHVVVATNGDRAPRDLLEGLARRGNSVFAHNAFDDFVGVRPIPIGLQNLSHLKSGVLEDYLLYRDALRQGQEEAFDRSNLVYASFNVANRPDERGYLRGLLEKSPYGFESRRVRPGQFRRNLLSSKFILSPPGAGPDCHRTWEALLLGAVPVVLKSSLAESLYIDSRILVVDDWDEFLGADSTDLLRIWESKRAEGIEKAYFNYWYAEIMSARRQLSSH